MEWLSSDNYLDFNDQVIDHFQNLYLTWLCVVLNGVLFVLSLFLIAIIFLLSLFLILREIQLTDWSTAGNLSNRFSGVQIPRDICTRVKQNLYSAKCSWIINMSY